LQTAHHFQITDSVTMPYLLYLPDDYTPDTEQVWPFILFLHGSGERGDTPDIIRLHGLPRLIETQPDFPYIVLSPQCPMDTRWPEQIDNVIALLDSALNALRVDHSRVYLTGLSMGGQGSWHLGATYPDRFAALLPICGRIPPVEGFPEKVCALQDVPVWAFHGAKDDRVPAEQAEQMASILHDCGGHVKLTIFPDADHFCWDRVYRDPAVWDWLQAQRR